jgi:hypothetical protein
MFPSGFRPPAAFDTATAIFTAAPNRFFSFLNSSRVFVCHYAGMDVKEAGRRGALVTNKKLSKRQRIENTRNAARVRYEIGVIAADRQVRMETLLQDAP